MAGADGCAHGCCREDGLRWEDVDDAGCRRVPTGPARPHAPLLLASTYGLGQFAGKSGRSFAGTRKRCAPSGDSSLPEVDQTVNVGIRSGREHDRDGRHEALGQTSSTQDNVDEAAPDTPVAVDEWMDGLELSMSDRGLRDRWKVVASDEAKQVDNEALDAVLGGGMKRASSGLISRVDG